MALGSTDIKLHLTGGSSNSNPALSLGGNVSSVVITSGVMNNLFRRITESEASSGVTIFRCVAVKNHNATDIMRNVVFYMVQDTKSNDDLALYSKAQAGKNTVETAIVDEFTAPTGSNINFIGSLSRSGGIALGNLSPNDYINLWLRYSVNPGAVQFPDDQLKVRFEVNPPETSEIPVPTPSPDPDSTGTNFQMVVLGDCSCGSSFDTNWSKIKARSPEWIVFNGDLAYKSGSTCFIDKIGSTWRAKSSISFGNHDVDEDESQPSTKNALLTAWGYSKTYNKKIFNNVGMIMMESGENQSVSDSVGSAQYNFVRDTLKDWDQNHPEIEWIFVFNHYPFYGPSSNHSNNGGGRDRYDPLFDTYGVDAVFTSHNHNLWTTKLLKYNSGSPSNPTTAGTDPNYSYSKSASNHGKLYFGSGAGGKSHYGIDSTPSYVVYSNDSDYGYVFLDFTNSGKKITFRVYTSSDALKKTLTLTHTA
ncbi:metallophosphoesterase family protein [Glutamicibacter sp.]|jgi:Predicted phosphohydrolases|uniref:metallophosphoesterase family protein n=1 Tax=Glutamicibacter sp. TaxID=1931995 RepID=UPI002B475C82|nr:metallophosphoesterase [Glutamicibacter sp.]HJX79145.1 metallophosphoesterase [Glutamicibacter sp.]